MKKSLSIILCFLCNFLSADVLQYAKDAAQLPVAFAVVREDSDQDLEIIKRYFPEEKISMLMVASGGCTAAHLVANAPLKSLTLVDPNKSQIALTKLKLHMLTLPVKKRLQILGYNELNCEKRKKIIQGLIEALEIDEHELGDLDTVAQFGLDYIGRYEKVFQALRENLVDYKNEIEDLFLLTDVQEQLKHIESDTEFGKALDDALDQVMSQENLVALFGPKATANRVQDFSRHFAAQIRNYLSHHLASESAWLAYMLLGRFHENCMFPWVQAKISDKLPEINYFQGFMNEALEQSKPAQYHVIHLSNIIDWLTAEEAQKTLDLAYRALKPGGLVIIRQLNSNIDIANLGKDFSWNLKASGNFLYNDRSFFYRNFFVGFKEKLSVAPQVKALADQVLNETSIIKGSFFNDLDTMSLEEFKNVQSQFWFAVDYFSRPMAALIARLPYHKDRIDILHNMVEEHGDFVIKNYHSNTFKQFLSTIGISKSHVHTILPSPAVNMFNYTLMGVCANEDPLIAIACDGIIEYAFSDISALLAEKVVQRGWVIQKDLVHYNVHADLDKQHAEEFFKIVEPYFDNSIAQEKIKQGLRLGAYIFNRLYEDLYAESKDKDSSESNLD